MIREPGGTTGLPGFLIPDGAADRERHREGGDSIPDGAASWKQHQQDPIPGSAGALNPEVAASPSSSAPAEPGMNSGATEPQHAAPAPAEPGMESGAAELQADQPSPTPSPSTTAEIDAAAIEAQLQSPGSTQSFAPITDEQLIDADSTYDAGTTTALMWGARSDVGCVRTHNEDSYLVQSPLFCVCDGMGGHAAGEVASSIAVETIARTAPESADPARLGAAVEAANAAVIDAAASGLGKPGMGCTATAAYIEDDTVAIAHVGDSRAYLLHNGSLIRITRDHSFVEELVDAGEITADEARTHPNRSVITRALGSDPAMYADHFQIAVEEGDRLILCSDGLSSMITDGEIEHIAARSTTAQMCTDNLVDAALAAGGGDNVTVVVVDLVDDGKLREAAKRSRRNVAIAIAALAVAIIAGIAITYFSVAGSVFLGVAGDRVAIYSGLPSSFGGVALYQLADETTIEVADLPADTQARLEEGIPQESMDAAIETVSKYRKQIFEEQTKTALEKESVRSAAEPPEADAPAAPAENEPEPAPEGGDAA